MRVDIMYPIGWRIHKIIPIGCFQLGHVWRIRAMQDNVSITSPTLPSPVFVPGIRKVFIVKLVRIFITVDQFYLTIYFVYD